MKKIIILAISLFLSFINLYSIDIVEQFTISGNNLKLFKVSSDYKYFYTIDDSNHYCIWDTHTHELLTQRSFTFTYNSIDVSNDGKYLFYDYFSFENLIYHVNKWNIISDSTKEIYSDSIFGETIGSVAYIYSFDFAKIFVKPKINELAISIGFYVYVSYPGPADCFFNAGYLKILNYDNNSKLATLKINGKNYNESGDSIKILAYSQNSSYMISRCNSDYYYSSWGSYGDSSNFDNFDSTCIIKNNSSIKGLPYCSDIASISINDKYIATTNQDTLKILLMDNLINVITVSNFSASTLLFTNDTKGIISSNPLQIRNIKSGMLVDSLLSNQNATGTMLFYTDDSTRYLLVDSNGHCTIFTYIDTLSTNSINESSIIQNIKAEVLPNPAFEEATLRYTLNRQSSVQIEIYNSLGERVMKIDEGLQIEGRHDCTININNLNSGLYYYRLIADGNVATGVMAVVK